MKWESGSPTKPGLYWFDIHFSNDYYKISTFVVQVSKSSTYLFGNYGSGPIEYYYHPHPMVQVFYSEIDQPKSWKKFTTQSKFEHGDKKVYWLKSPEGYLGVGLGTISSDEIYGTIVWLNHPSTASGSSVIIKPNTGWEISLLKAPKREK